MTAEQSLAGAMGCASWRAHYRLREYAAVASVGHVIRGGTSLRIDDADVADLNEVGITDGVLAAIWRFGPDAAAYAVSSRAEANHLGADIAIVQLSASRILLYQAKLARLRDDAYRLKSQVTKGQLKLLGRRRPIEILGIRYQVTGRLALYQQDLTPYLSNAPLFIPDMWWRFWPDVPGPLPAGIRGELEPMPSVGRQYYETMLASRGCSPSGVLAALVPAGNNAATSVATASTWPWEFDAYQWLRQTPTHGDDHQADVDMQFGGAAPEFDAYTPTLAEPLSRAQIAGSSPRGPTAADIAGALAEQLRLPVSTHLYVITLP